MSADLASTSTSQEHSLFWLVYLFLGGLLLVIVYSGTRAMLASTPSREAVADLEPHGLVTVRFATDPNPPLPLGTAGLSSTLTDEQRRSIEVDWARFEYSTESSSQPVATSHAQPMGDGSGMLMAQAQFSQVGTWWLRFQMGKGDSQAEVRFTFASSPRSEGSQPLGIGATHTVESLSAEPTSALPLKGLRRSSEGHRRENVPCGVSLASGRTGPFHSPLYQET